ncbi:MAG: adenosine deaminase family protein [Candidatus Caenarcaniphilales bacterium]|jgi:adenosine deaminase|nr:adenosine deaminase family protein [Candidatus Caenarcaniphilales bacterium]
MQDLAKSIKQLPKADLHVHLDGSLRLATIIDLAKELKVELPSYSEDGLKELVFKANYQNLPEYLEGFKYTCAVMQDAEALERTAYEFAWDCFHDGVIYVEPRYSPELLKGNKLKAHEVILAVDRGMKKAQKEINIIIDKINQELRFNKVPENIVHPAFVYSHIICCMRMWDPQRSLETATCAVVTKQKHDIPIMAIDLAGPEDGFPAVDHQDAFIYAHKNFLYKTVHAGEAYGPASIFQALTYLHADRIGHGLHLFNTAMVINKTGSEAEEYVKNIVQYLAERRITLEVCLTSNLQTLPLLANDVKNHSLNKMLAAGLSVAICTDNRLVSNTTVTKELLLAHDSCGFSPKTLKKIIMYGIKRGFFPGTYLEKKKYIDDASRYYDYIVS